MHELHSKESWPDVLYALEALSRVSSLCRLTMISRRYAVQPYYVFIEGLDGRLRILDTREEIDALLAAHGRTDKGTTLAAVTTPQASLVEMIDRRRRTSV